MSIPSIGIAFCLGMVVEAVFGLVGWFLNGLVVALVLCLVYKYLTRKPMSANPSNNPSHNR